MTELQINMPLYVHIVHDLCIMQFPVDASTSNALYICIPLHVLLRTQPLALVAEVQVLSTKVVTEAMWLQ